MGGSVFLLWGRVMGNDNIINLACLLFGVTIVASFIFKASQPSSEDLIKDGKYLTTACTLKEVNIPGGFLTSNINRLDCSGVIVNVETYKYDRAVSAYEKSKPQG
jgi:hypothetical protein